MNTAAIASRVSLIAPWWRWLRSVRFALSEILADAANRLSDRPRWDESRDAAISSTVIFASMVESDANTPAHLVTARSTELPT
jgi:hypothetical protein